MSSNPAVAQRKETPGSAAQGDILESVFALVAEDFAAVNTLIPRQLTSDVALVEEIGHHIVESGGKRLRPLMVLLGAYCCGYSGQGHIRLATIIEFLHTAMLLHDDVVDHSELRRGAATANALWGNPPSVLVGDFLYSRAFQLMVELESMDIMAILSDATNTIAEGEVMQLANVGNCALSEAQYMNVIRCKTAMLFQAATHTAGVLASKAAEQITALRDFGLHFGLAYQLVDDWLDYVGDANTMGKNVGDDLAEGKLTLPLIHALANAPQAEADVIRQAIAEQSASHMSDVLRIVQSSGALDYTLQAALTQSERAAQQLRALPDNSYRDALHTLTNFCVDRLR
ncbi:MAG: octaprenyl diphosphate synthase [Gammaproteobacteria bacterium]|nr:octaprenyl diphosphate synthase [Gammaproteobacteria bacterium]|tara:strand:+ start:1053 stop:2081 length:1029 start_codon:yes stop_codon:yes gene_type:complete